MQSSALTRTTPMTSSRYRASVGQAATQAGRRHRWQTLGTSSPTGSILVTLMRAVAVPNWPSWWATQATSQARQPLHTSFRTRIRFKVSSHHLELRHKNQATSPSTPRPFDNPSTLLRTGLRTQQQRTFHTTDDS
jgi:hypothetical protein